MNKIINGVASEYDIPMIYENKTTTNRLKNEEIFTRWQDPTIEKLRQENQQLQNRINDAIDLIKELACYEQDTHTYCRDIIYYDVHKIVDELKGKSE